MHTCPDCGQACYCNDDIEDHDTGDNAQCWHFDECWDEGLTEDEDGIETTDQA